MQKRLAAEDLPALLNRQTGRETRMRARRERLGGGLERSAGSMPRAPLDEQNHCLPSSAVSQRISRVRMIALMGRPRASSHR